MLKSIQQTLILALCVLVPSLAKGAALNADEAKNVAAEFFQSGEIHRLADRSALTLAHTVNDATGTPVCYVFNATDGKGFVIISADDTALPVIGYSTDNSWVERSVPAAAANVLAVSTAGMYDNRGPVRVRRYAAAQSKILTTPSWSQEAPFNNNIPNRRLTGCVGVALAEIMKYHAFPANRPSSLVQDGQTTAYAWEIMRNDNHRNGYTAEEADAVATLVADAAIAIGTDFGMSSSSAFEVKVPFALVSMMGYDAGVSYKKRAEMDKASWEALIVNEIDEGRPVLYSGQDVSSGHAFVCDGYEMRGGTPYLHINWGWGGSANGYFASDALNPVVSRAHSYNDLTTIIYNIKPATVATEWSPIHLTSDERQVGLTLDVADVPASGTFTARAGALKNISNTDFKGKLSIALFDAAGNQKALLNAGRNFNLVALQISRYVDFTCQLPAGTTVADGDVVRLVTMAADSSEWLPVAGDLLAGGEVAAKGGVIPYFTVTIPAAAESVEIPEAEPRVIKGRDYTFKVIPTVATKVVTVKANGFILTADANNNYKIANVLEDQNIDIIVQNAADVLTKSTLWVQAGNLENLLDEKETATVTDLTLFGTMNVNDFSFIRDRMKLNRLDISQVTIVASGSNPANAIPTKAFMGYRSLKQIILPKNLTTFKNGCLAQTGLTSIEIPAGVGTWEYNVFVSCNALREVIVRRATPAWVNWCVFSGVPKNRLVVPVGASAAYKAKEYWQDFKEIVEENAVAPDSYSVTVAQNKGIRFIAQTEGTEFAPGASYVFSAEPDDSFGDATVEVYANATRLSPDASGNYTAKITANTLIHFESKQPEPTTPDTTWKLTGDAGGIGLVTDVVNVLPGKSFTVRANAIKVPAGADGSKFFAMVLTDKDGAIKEFISPVYNGSTLAAGNQSFNFGCQVVDATVKEGNLIRLATSYNKKAWNLVGADAEVVCDRLAARNNQVVYHSVTMPASINGARIEGGASQVVRGMPFSVKVTPNSPSDRVTLAVNGTNKAVSQAVANVTIPAVTEDLDITIQIHPAGASDFVVVNVNEGELAAKLAECPDRLKLVGTILVSEFDALRAKASTIIDLDLADVTIKGAAMTANSIPENAFAPKTAGASSALKSIVLPSSLERIDQNAFARCLSLTEISIPASVTFVGNGAFAQCSSLKKIIMEGFTPPATGTMSPLPSNTSGITLEVPRGAESAYSSAAFWSVISPQPAKILYWIKYDNTRAFVYTSYYGDGSKIEFDPNSSTMVQVSMGLPNCPAKSKSDGIYRPGDIFKVYDNGAEVSDFLGPDQYGYGGQYSVKFNPTLLKYGDQYVTHRYYPQNHVIDVVFFYPISFEMLEGATGVKAELKNTEGGEVYNAPMSQYVYGASGNKTVYREDRNYKFSLDAPAGIELAVEVEHNVLVKTAKGNAPAEYETRSFEVYPDDQGLYTITSLPGDTKVYVRGKVVIEEGQPVSADMLEAVSKDNVDEFTQLTVTGELGEEDFGMIREKFESVETLDLSQIDNEVIPEGAFAGMESLNTVIIPETITEIGAGAFAGCENIETITLPGVNSIGEGAFEGCGNLTSILLPSLGSAEAGAASGMRKAPQIEGVTVESFRGLNPNCLIYIGSVDIPNAEELNIILNINGQRVAASDIHLDGNHSFNAPASFLLGDYKIAFTADLTASDACDVDGGWKTLILPFQPTGMEYGEEIGQREGSGLHILSFDGQEAEAMTAQTEIVPNRPYLANVCAPFASVPVTFFATAREQGEEIVYDVPYTPVPEDLVAVGKDFSLYGSYDGESRHVTSYVLTDEGNVFIAPVSQDSVSIRPFTAYLSPNEGTQLTEFKIGEHPVWVREPAPANAVGTHLYRSSKIELASPTANASIYYTIDGSDPALADGTRQLYEAPLTMAGPTMSVRAIAEYKGNRSDVVTLDYELRKADIDYTLVQNWNWIAHNTEDAVPVSEFATAGISRVVSQTEETVRDPRYGLVGSLKDLKPLTGYKAYVTDEAWTGNIKGVAFDPSAPVQLTRGWNWIGCPLDADESLLITDLFSALEVEEGEMIVGLDGFEQVDADGTWKGTLGSLVPGTGYMFFSNSDKEFVYTIAAPTEDEDEAIKAPRAAGRWVADNHKYPSVMPVTAALISANGTVLDASSYEIAAFCGDECRGTGVMVDGSVMINVHGLPGDRISFRLFTPAGEEIISETSVVFSEMPAGTMSDPFAITAAGTTAISAIEAGIFEVVTENGSILLKGDLSSVLSAEVYDLSGTRIATAAIAGGALVSDKLETGVYIVVIRTTESTEYVKVLVK